MEYDVYVQHTSNSNMILVCLYVDDILLTENFSDEIVKFKKLKYELELLKRFELINCKSAITPAETNHKLDSDVEGDCVDATIFKQLVDSLRYLCNTRPDIYYAVGMYLGGPISWCSKKQQVVALSTCETEYIACVLSACQAVWIMNLLLDLKIKLVTIFSLFSLPSASSSSVYVVDNNILHYC
ncbi:uncharacterized protein LOC127122131 [Lathyrus oleraceus]|uniref:uncharacterized protein LOC127122131 n=1 Tax=Pisum sativum TaxID=3888 RepID=UPI0021CDFCA0|nr:uncharacterized protein LOC127122131 [Pisum sativum]